MSKLASIESLMIKQTCRIFAHECEISTVNQNSEDSSIYSLKFLKALHDDPKANIHKVLEAASINNDNYKVISVTNLLIAIY